MLRTLTIGAGPIGQASVGGLQTFSNKINPSLISIKFPGEGGGTGDFAAGYGGRFVPSNDVLAKMVDDSYEHSMRLARQPDYKSVELCINYIVKTGQEGLYKNKVENYDGGTGDIAKYDAFCFSPVGWGKRRIDDFKKNGGDIIQSAIPPEYIEPLLTDSKIPGYDYVIVCTGLSLRDMRPDLGLYPVLGGLVHFPANILPKEDGKYVCYMDETAILYVISRPCSTVVGGTCLAHLSHLTTSQQHEIARDFVERANKKFNLSIKFEQRINITFKPRPTTAKGPVMEFGNNVAFINGFEGQGYVPWWAIQQRVYKEVNQRFF